MQTTVDLARLVDSHAHLDAPEFDPDREEAVRRAFDAGIIAILCPADLTNPGSLPAIRELARTHPTVLAAAGVKLETIQSTPYGSESPMVPYGDPKAARSNERKPPSLKPICVMAC